MKPWPNLLRRRWPFIAPFLAAATVLIAAYWLLAEDAAMEVPEPPAAGVSTPLRPLAASAETAADAPPPAPDEAAEATEKPAGPVDIFAVRTWEPPAPVVDPATAPPPPPPTAPPVPFRYAGKLEEAGKPPVFFLAQDEKILAVSPGDLINGRYRVGKIEGGQLHFLYRPMKVQQSIPAGGDT